MGNLRAAVTVALIAFTAACGDDAATPDAPIVIVDAAIDAPPDAYVPDAPNYDLTCITNTTPPATASATIQLSGTAQEVVLQGTTPSVQPAAGVTIQACKVNTAGNCTGQNNLGTVGPTTANGAFMTAAIANAAMTPLDGYLVATKTNFRTTRVYPAAPLTMDQAGVPVLLLGNQTIALAVGAGFITHSAGNAIVGVLVTDCSTPPQPIAGATVTVTQAGQPVGNTQDASLLDPMGAGAFITFDVPPGIETTVAASYNGMTFRSHVVDTTADGTTTTQVRPGF
jgi:hypothetical protein